MKNRVTAVIDVDATVEEAYAYWRRSHRSSPEPGQPATSATRVPWVVRVNGIEDDGAPAHSTVTNIAHLFTWASSEEGSPTGEVAFEPLETGQTRVTISMEWERPDSQASYIPLIFLDGVQVNADLRGFKRELELESEARDSPGWEHTLHRFEAM